MAVCWSRGRKVYRPCQLNMRIDTAINSQHGIFHVLELLSVCHWYNLHGRQFAVCSTVEPFLFGHLQDLLTRSL